MTNRVDTAGLSFCVSFSPTNTEDNRQLDCDAKWIMDICTTLCVFVCET